MFPASVALLAFLPVINAQSTVSLFLPMFDEDAGLVGSISASDRTATTYVITCASEATPTAAAATSPSGYAYEESYDESGCGLGTAPLTLTQGPSTYHFDYAAGPFTATIDCVLDGTTSATCTAARPSLDYGSMTDMTDSRESGPTAVTTILGGTDMSGFLPVTITAGGKEDVATATATNTDATTNPAAGNVKSTAATETGAALAKATGAVASASKANSDSPSSTGGAADVHVFSALGGLMALAVGIVAAIL